VCPLSKVEEMVEIHQPERVISLLAPGWPFPELEDKTRRHLCLSLHDIHDARDGEIAPSRGHVQEVIRFVEEMQAGKTLLVHCYAGISRSTATAFIAACVYSPLASELDVAMALRQASPLARPNLALVRHADEELGREGRMVNAIVDTGRNLPWITVEENEPFSIHV